MSLRRGIAAGLSGLLLAACDPSSESFHAAKIKAITDGYRELCAGVFVKDFPIHGKDSSGNSTLSTGYLITEAMPNIFDSGVELLGPDNTASYTVTATHVVAKNMDGYTSTYACRPELENSPK